MTGVRRTEEMRGEFCLPNFKELLPPMVVLVLLLLYCAVSLCVTCNQPMEKGGH